MRWPWLWRRHVPDEAASRAAREQSQAKLEQTHRCSEEVRQVSQVLRDLRARNRFGEMITDSMRRTR